MEIMKGDSCSPGWLRAAATATMCHGARSCLRSRQPALRHWRKEPFMNMQWQTPAAIDWRFGFEISLYVANR
ncbi:MAG: pyrroloquinoline quinone precursor peptide PqqA [Aquincola sp.]|nr:pyrroloquinoline quinone precursor peptide PqqA [Aquincola sp.]